MDLRISFDVCKNCGALWVDHPDFIKPKWEYPDCHPGMYHELANRQGDTMEYYYYLRDRYHKPIGTVCLLAQDGNFARGLAICSKLDNPNKKIGRAIAYGRALKALERKRTDIDIRRTEALIALGHTQFLPGTFDFSKSCFDPEHTSYERKIMGVN